VAGGAAGSGALLRAVPGRPRLRIARRQLRLRRFGDGLARGNGAGRAAASPCHAPAAKRLHWHADYLLEETAVEIRYITVILTALRVESDLARWLAGLPGAVPIVAGFGASDAPGQTHLLRLNGNWPYGRDGRLDLHLTDFGFPIQSWFQPSQSQ
jgi:hypothetical protein